MGQQKTIGRPSENKHNTHTHTNWSQKRHIYERSRPVNGFVDFSFIPKCKVLFDILYICSGECIAYNTKWNTLHFRLFRNIALIRIARWPRVARNHQRQFKCIIPFNHSHSVHFSFRFGVAAAAASCYYTILYFVAGNCCFSFASILVFFVFHHFMCFSDTCSIQ